MFQQVFTNGVKLQDQFFGKLYISSVKNTTAEITNNTMVHNLEVNGNTKIIGDIRFSGDLYKNDVLFTGGGGNDWIKTGNNINYNAGNVGIGDTNPLYQLSLGTHLDNGGDGKLYVGRNTGNGSARFFTIKYNAGYDMCCSDSDNKDVLRVCHAAPANSFYANNSGNIGLGTASPSQKLTIQGKIQLTGQITAGRNYFAGPSYNGGFYSGDTNWGFRINHFGGNQYWTEARGHDGASDGARGFRLFNNWNNTFPFSVNNVGNMSIKNNTWHKSIDDGRERVYYAINSTTYYKGNSFYIHTWRNAGDQTRMELYDNGGLWIAGILDNTVTVESKNKLKI